MQKLLVLSFRNAELHKCTIYYDYTSHHVNVMHCMSIVCGARQCVQLLCLPLLLLVLGVIREPTLQLQLLLLHRRAHPKVTTTIPISYSHHHHHVHQHHCYQDHLHMLVQGVIPTCSCSCPPVERRHPQVITITII